MSSQAAVALLAIAALVLLTGCESSQTKSARLAKEGKEIATRKGIVVTRQNPDVKILDTTLLQDENGTAAVVAIRNGSQRALIGVPISIDVKGPGGKRVFRNDQPDLGPGLARAAALAGGAELAWVHDQVDTVERAKSVEAKVGEPSGRPPRSLPRIDLTAPRVEADPITGVSARAAATNRSKIVQRDLVIYAVGRRAGRVVAAGRAQIRRLRPARRTRFEVLFIGNPKGATVTLSAPPTTLE